MHVSLCFLLLAVVPHVAVPPEVFAPIADTVLVSEPNEKGVSKIVSVGELVPLNGPKPGDKVNIDTDACTQNPAPVERHCIISHQRVFGRVEPISNVLTVTPPPEPATDAPPKAVVSKEVDIKGSVYSLYGQYQAMTSTTTDVTVVGAKKTYTFQATWVPNANVLVGGGSYDFEGTVASGDTYVTTATPPGIFGGPPGPSGSSAPWHGTHQAADLSNGYVDVYAPGTVYLPIFTAITSVHDPAVIISPGMFAGTSRVDNYAPSGAFDSAVSCGRIKLERWGSRSFTGPPEATSYELTDGPTGGYTFASRANWAVRLSWVFTLPGDAKTEALAFTITLVASNMHAVYVDDVQLGTDTAAGTYTYLIMGARGDRKRIKMELKSISEGSSDFSFTFKQGSFNPVGKPALCPDETISVYARVDGASTWDASLAQAFLQTGYVLPLNIEVTRVPEDETSDVGTSVWHIADIEPFTNAITIINTIETNAEVLAALAPAPIG